MMTGNAFETIWLTLEEKTHLVVISVFSLSLVYVLSRFIVYARSNKTYKEPPGPPGIPFFGNEFQIPADKQWLKFHEWGEKFGEIVKITALGQPVFILNSAQAAFDLLDSRGTIYSDRPKSIMAGELVGWDRGLGYASYGERFKQFRKLFHQTMGSRAIQDLLPIEERENARLLLKLLQKPDDFFDHARQSVGAAILKLSYGYSVESDDDHFVRIAEVANEGFCKASEPGAFIVDRFPFLKYLPPWFPGAGFHLVAKKMRNELEDLYDTPFDFVVKEMASGRAVPSFTSRFLSEKERLTEYDKELIKAAAASLYSGGADTTTASICSFILAMTLFPEVQKRGQAEIDAVVGKDRLPNSSDRTNLPYVNAIVKEVLRWCPPAPLGLPHKAVQDDSYKGYHIPKGAIIWANIWSMLHDEQVYPEPFSFIPERFLNVKEKAKPMDPETIAFGFGRRICPGMHLADSSIYITVATILATFDITKKRNPDGKEIDPEVDFVGFICHPRPFQCCIRPRSKVAAKLIEEAASENGFL